MDTQASYDQVAAEYAKRIYMELAYKPFDREQLAHFAAQVKGLGPVCDLGCGPGQVARYLRDQGVDAFGVDLSPGMIQQAKALNPDLEFFQGSMLALAFADATWGGIAAFYSIIHVPRHEVICALAEMKRVLRPGGRLLLAFHIGDAVLHLEEWWDKPVAVDFVFFQRLEMEGYLQAAGFVVEASLEREPYPDVEHQSRRAYILARKVE